MFHLVMHWRIWEDISVNMVLKSIGCSLDSTGSRWGSEADSCKHSIGRLGQQNIRCIQQMRTCKFLIKESGQRRQFISHVEQHVSWLHCVEGSMRETCMVGMGVSLNIYVFESNY
jgi:hypothetical protein